MTVPLCLPALAAVLIAASAMSLENLCSKCMIIELQNVDGVKFVDTVRHEFPDVQMIYSNEESESMYYVPAAKYWFMVNPSRTTTTTTTTTTTETPTTIAPPPLDSKSTTLESRFTPVKQVTPLETEDIKSAIKPLFEELHKKFERLEKEVKNTVVEASMVQSTPKPSLPSTNVSTPTARPENNLNVLPDAPSPIKVDAVGDFFENSKFHANRDKQQSTTTTASGPSKLMDKRGALMDELKTTPEPLAELENASEVENKQEESTPVGTKPDLPSTSISKPITQLEDKSNNLPNASNLGKPDAETDAFQRVANSTLTPYVRRNIRSEEGKPTHPISVREALMEKLQTTPKHIISRRQVSPGTTTTKKNKREALMEKLKTTPKPFAELNILSKISRPKPIPRKNGSSAE